MLLGAMGHHQTARPLRPSALHAFLAEVPPAVLAVCRRRAPSTMCSGTQRETTLLWVSGSTDWRCCTEQQAAPRLGLRPRSMCAHVHSVQRSHCLPWPRRVLHPLRLHLLCCPVLQWLASCLPRPRSSPTSAWPSSTWVSAAGCWLHGVQFRLFGAPAARSMHRCACCAAKSRFRAAPAPQRVERGATACASLALRHTCPSLPSFNPFGSGRVPFHFGKPKGTPSSCLPLPHRLRPLLDCAVEPLWPLPGAGGHRQPAR